MTSHTDPPTPKWIAPWLALLPPLYFLSPLALLGLPYLKRLPKPALWVLGFYALSQQVAALFSPEPFLASGLAIVRTLLILGLIGTGVVVGRSSRFSIIYLGLAIVYFSSVFYSLIGRLQFGLERLGHPYMTSTTLGLSGVVGFWGGLFLIDLKPKSRITLLFSGLVITLLSGSRIAVFSLLLGSAIPLIYRKKKEIWLFLAMISISIALLIILFAKKDTILNRMLSIADSGRREIWSNAISLFQAFPIGGVGSYRIGKYLTALTDNCNLFDQINQNHNNCTGMIDKLGSPWLISHNLILQNLNESGIIGTGGLIILLSYVLINLFSVGNSFQQALISGILVSNLVDNTLVAPSPFYAEIFWMMCGSILINGDHIKLSISYTSILLLILFAFPVFWFISEPNKNVIHVKNAYHPETALRSDLYTIVLEVEGLSGKYDAVIQNCAYYCATAKRMRFTYKSNSRYFLNTTIRLFKQNQVINVKFYDTLSGSVMGEDSWSVVVHEK